MPEPGTERRGGRKIALAVVAVAVVSGGLWLARHPEFLARSGNDDASLKADAALNPPLASAPAPARVEAPAPVASAAAPKTAPQPVETESEPSAAENAQGKIAVVKGINPSRPAGVFLLISNEASVLYRKKRDDPGEGIRVPIPAGEKASVAISRDELIRVAQGKDVVILFQGAKVPPNLITGGAWISFVPK